MLDDIAARREIAAYPLKLMILSDAFAAGERSRLLKELQDHAGALTCDLAPPSLEDGDGRRLGYRTRTPAVSRFV